jgi:hypothetical protein
MPEKKIEMFTDTEFEHCMPVTADASEIANMVEGDEHIPELNDRSVLDIEYSYPLSGKFVLSINHPFEKTEWTRRDLFLAIQKGYYEIYEAEDTAPRTGIFREKDTGPYGIWGHDIGDLVIEIVRVMPSGKIKLGIGS